MASGILHVYHPARHLNLFEFLPYTQAASTSISVNNIRTPNHVLLFVGGMYDTFNNPGYPFDIARLFPISSDTQQPWRVMHVQLSSNGRSWGISSIDRDIEEIATAVEFIRTKLYPATCPDVVLMGHSTGCQDIMRYLTAPNPLRPGKSASRLAVQGAILQAPVSDRDGVVAAINDDETPDIRKGYDAAMEIIANTKESDRRDVILPMKLTRSLFGPTPICIERFLSLVSPESPQNPSSEDFFSHDLSDETFKATFGSIGRNGVLRSSRKQSSSTSTSTTTNAPEALLVLMSDSDEYVKPHVSQKKLLERWKTALTVESGCTLDPDSEVILNAIHDVSGTDWPSQEARLVRLRAAVLNYLGRCVGDVPTEAWDIYNKERDAVMTLKRNDGRDVDKQIGVLKL